MTTEKKDFAVQHDQAVKEVEGWLDKIKATASQREAYKANIDRLIEAVEDGVLTIDSETGEITHQLKVSFGEELTIATLKYKTRLKVKDVSNAQRGVKNDDGDGRVLGYIVALTGQAREILRNMDIVDYQIAESIAPFFAI